MRQGSVFSSKPNPFGELRRQRGWPWIVGFRLLLFFIFPGRRNGLGCVIAPHFVSYAAQRFEH
ncbi:hypothetical protein CSB97_0358 [Pseudomonas aeruginosa]|nr:hypothetical protein CSB97_0358 [Pseudomonas aeruginosa]RCH02455.1 hypothetical protein CSC36_0466 [Pseudomonas aeruginosa]